MPDTPKASSTQARRLALHRAAERRHADRVSAALLELRRLAVTR